LTGIEACGVEEGDVFHPGRPLVTAEGAEGPADKHAETKLLQGPDAFIRNRSGGRVFRRCGGREKENEWDHENGLPEDGASPFEKNHVRRYYIKNLSESLGLLYGILDDVPTERIVRDKA